MRKKAETEWSNGGDISSKAIHTTDEWVGRFGLRWMDLIDFLPDATLAIDLDGRVIAWNRAIVEMTGIPAENMLGRGNYEYVEAFGYDPQPILVDFVLNPDRKREAYFKVVRKRRDHLHMEVWIENLKGKIACLWCNASPLYDRSGSVVGAIESIRDITDLKRKEQDLEKKANDIQDLNAALRVLLKQREEDRGELEDKILMNVKVLIQPLVEKLNNHVSESGKTYLEEIDARLKEIISPFAHRLSVNHLSLTNKEIQVASLIKEGRTTKEIAGMLFVSESAINVYRHNIRKKMGLAAGQNLNAYLLSLPEY